MEKKNLDNKELEKVVGGKYDLPEILKLEPGQCVCSNCGSIVTPNLTEDGKKVCPTCMLIIQDVATEIPNGPAQTTARYRF